MVSESVPDIVEKICWSDNFRCDAQLSSSRWRTRVETSWWKASLPRQDEFQIATSVQFFIWLFTSQDSKRAVYQKIALVLCMKIHFYLRAFGPIDCNGILIAAWSKTWNLSHKANKLNYTGKTYQNFENSFAKKFQ